MSDDGLKAALTEAAANRYYDEVTTWTCGACGTTNPTVDAGRCRILNGPHILRSETHRIDAALDPVPVSEGVRAVYRNLDGPALEETEPDDEFRERTARLMRDNARLLDRLAVTDGPTHEEQP